ncbi:hypothetical protein ACEQPO_29355 [Bacillus sp. SL00103]
MNRMNIATIGTGVIVSFLQGIEELDGASCHAVYSRKGNGKKLADRLV